MDYINHIEQLLEKYPTNAEKIKCLEIIERQRYNYYCDCSSNFTTEQDKEYNKTWDWILNKINELKETES